MSAVYQATRHPEYFIGAVGYTCGFGLEGDLAIPPTSPDPTADIRDLIVETDITGSTTPLLLFLTGNDAIIDGSPNAGYNEALFDRASLFPSQHTAYWKAVGDPSVAGHDNPYTFGNVTYGVDTVDSKEAVRRKWNEWMAGVSAQRSSKVTLA